jgi:hypothetical protein
MPEPILILDIRDRRDLINRETRYATLSDEVHAWLQATGIAVPDLRFEFEPLDGSPDHVRSFPVVEFEDEREALAFKLRWL